MYVLFTQTVRVHIVYWDTYYIIPQPRLRKRLANWRVMAEGWGSCVVTVPPCPPSSVINIIRLWIILDNKDAACYFEITGNVAEFTVKKTILFLMILCMLSPMLAARFTLAAIPVQGLGLGTLGFASVYVGYVGLWVVIKQIQNGLSWGSSGNYCSLGLRVLVGCLGLPHSAVTKGRGGGGILRDPTSVFRVFYYFRVQFFHRYFLLLSHSW